MERAYAPEGSAGGHSMAFYARFAAFCPGVEMFDPGAFRLSAPEAAAVDPQVRMLMEETAAACSSAGVLGGAAGGVVGVFVGSMYHEHLDIITATAAKLSPQAIVGNGAPYMVGRLSYTFGLTGPCVSTDTACSSSLVATHLAAGALRAAECAAAVAGGANIMLLADTTAAICQLQALSPVGRCKTFDSSADGYGRGEGVAVLVLRAAGGGGNDAAPACALIRGSAVNQGGRSSGLTAPNGPAQTALIRAALVAAGVDAAQLGVISVHGTGTPLGDPIEVGALSAALPSSRAAGGSVPLTLVSNKACYGHTEGTAGITGLLAALGPLRHAAVPAVMHLRTPNAYVTAALSDWSRTRGTPTCVPRETAPALCGGGAALLTGTSSFGMSGVNAHAILSAPTLTPAARQVDLAWQRQRAYVLAKPHALLTSAAASARGGEAAFACTLAAAALAHMWQHQVSGAPCISAAALLELAAAAGAAAIPDGDHRSHLVLRGAALAAVVTLPEDGHPAVTLLCSVQLRSGAVAISSGGQLATTATLEQLDEPSRAVAATAILQPLSASLTGLLPWLRPPAQPSVIAALSTPVSLAAESYNLDPAALQAALLPDSPDASVLASAEVAVMPTSAAAVAGASTGSGRAQLLARSDAQLCAASVHGVRYLPARQLGLKPASAGSTAAELLYAVAWQATAPLSAAAEREAAVIRSVASRRRGRFIDAAQRAAAAGGDLVQLLAQHHQALPGNVLSMLSRGAVAALPTPAAVGDHTEAAFLGGILKNLPYELPILTAHQADVDPAHVGARRRRAGSYALSAQPLPAAWEADMYGAASRSGALYRPRLHYSAATAHPAERPEAGLLAAVVGGACLVTGGLGGLGMLAADWAAGSGAPALALLGRSGYLGAGAPPAALLHGRALVVMTKSDAALREDASGAALAAQRLPRHPLVAVIHAAGVQVEARLLRQTPRAMRQAGAPKLEAARSCGAAAAADPLRVSLLFSSVSSVTGNAGHANYAAANAALDALAERHASMGEPVAAVQWGAWASVGMVHNRYRISQKQAAAMGMLSSEAGLAVMATVLRAAAAATPALGGGVLGAAPQAYWRNLLQNAPAVPDIFSALDVPSPAAAPAAAPAAHAAPAVPTAASAESVEATVRRIAAAILGMEVDAEQPLALQGLDSLAGLEMRQKLQEALGVELALLAEDPQGATVGSIVAEALAKMPKGGAIVPAPAAGAAVSGGGVIDEVEPVRPIWVSPTPVAIKMRLFCLPWAGGVSENLFARWSMMLPASVQVCPVEIPGRGRREGETALTTVAELAATLAACLPLQDKPYALFGTCLGAIVSYEVIREVQRTKCAPLPVAFMPAAVSPPHVYASVVMKIYLQRRLRRGEEPPLEEVLSTLHSWKEMPREKLLLAFEAGHFAGVDDMKKSERLFNRVAPMGVNDIMMAVQYRYNPSLPPLPVPLVVFDGARDNTIPSGYMKGWRRHTTAGYKHIKVDGDHYFVSTHYREVTATLNQECLALMERMRGGILGAGHSWVAPVGELPPADAAGKGANSEAAGGAESDAAARRGRAPGLPGSALLLLMALLLLLGALAKAGMRPNLLRRAGDY